MEARTKVLEEKLTTQPIIAQAQTMEKELGFLSIKVDYQLRLMPRDISLRVCKVSELRTTLLLQKSLNL